MRKRLICTAVTVVLFSSGCTTINDTTYQRPVTNIEALPLIEADAEAKVVRTWESYVGDDVLRSLIETSLAYNSEVGQALENLNAARAQYRVTVSNDDPSISLNGRGAAQGSEGQRNQTYSSNLSLDSYEIDLFNRIGSIESAALATYQAQEEQVNATRQAVIHSVIARYIDLLESRDTLTILKRLHGHYKHIYHLNDMRFDRGVEDQSAVDNARIALNQSESRIVNEEERYTVAQNALKLLTGEWVELEPESPFEEKKPVLTSINRRLNSDVLLDRPDVKAMEHQLRARYADVDAAKAALFPRITLTGQVGYQSTELKSLFSNPATWSITPSLYLPVFNRNTLKADVEQVQAEREAAVHGYRDVVRTAFQEISDQLAERERITKEVALSEKTLIANRSQEQRMQDRFDQGVESLIPVVEAHINRLNAELIIVQLKYYRINNDNGIYSSIGI